MLVAVAVQFPAVLLVRIKVLVPETKAVLAGNTSLGSVVIRPIVLALLTTFQFVSTALTITLKPAPAVCTLGVPVLPVLLPAAALSPGIRSCSFVKTPALTVYEGLVLAVLLPSVISVAVAVQLPAV